MAQFTPYQNTPDPKQYANPSPIDVGRPDSTVATAIQGGAQILDAGIKAVDDVNKDTIDKQLFQDINLKRQEYTNANAALLGEHTPPQETGDVSTAQAARNTPTAIDAAYRRMAMITQANKMGKYDDVMYYGEMQEINQRVASQFPGYARYIQDRAAHWLGSNSANAQRSAIQTSLQQQAAAGKADGEKWSNEMERDRKYFLNPDGSFNEQGFNGALNTSDPQARNNIRVNIARQAAGEHSISVRKAAIEAEDSERKITGERGVQHYQEVASIEAAVHMERAQFNFMGKSMTLKDANELVARIRASGGQVDPTVLAQLGTAVGQLQEGLDMKLKSLELGTRINGRALSTISNPTELAKVREYYKDIYFGSIKRQVGEGNLNLATSMLNTSTGRQELQAVKNLENEVMAEWNGMEKTVGGPALAAIINNRLATEGPQLLSGINQTLSRLRMQQVAASKNFGSLNTAFEQFNMVNPAGPGGVKTDEQKREQANYLRNEVDTMKEFIIQPNAAVQSPELAVRAARAIAHPGSTDFLSKLPKDEQMQVFANVNAPNVAAKIKELSKNDPQIWQNHVEWSNYTFKRLFNTQIASVQQGVQDSFGTNLKWNPDTQQIEFKNIRGTQQAARDGTLPVSTTTMQAVNNINIGLRSLGEVAKLNGQQLTPEYLKNFGINLEMPPKPAAGARQSSNGIEPPIGISFNPIGSAQASELPGGPRQRVLTPSEEPSMGNRFNDTFDQIPAQSVNEPLEEAARSRLPFGLTRKRTAK